MVSTDEQKVVIKFLRENVTIDLEWGDKCVACNVSDIIVKAFYLAIRVWLGSGERGLLFTKYSNYI